MKISSHKREELIRHIEDPATAVGIQIPETINWKGEEIRLRDEVWKLTHGEEDEGKKEELVEMIMNIIKETIKEIQSGEITEEKGEILADLCVGLKRAVGDLLIRKNEGNPEEKMKEQEIDDQKRWLDLVKRLKH